MKNSISFFNFNSFSFSRFAIYVLISTVFYSCHNTTIENQNETILTASSDTSQVSNIVSDTLASSINSSFTDTHQVTTKSPRSLSKGKEDSPLKGPAMSENGNLIQIQEIISETEFKNHPDTIKVILANHYTNQIPNFPVAIADNFEKGISKERKVFPELKYEVRLYENNRSQNPYHTALHAVKMNLGKITVY